MLTLWEVTDWTTSGRMFSFTTASARLLLLSARRPRAKAAVCWTPGTTSSSRGRSKDITPAGQMGRWELRWQCLKSSISKKFSTCIVKDFYILRSGCQIRDGLDKLHSGFLVLLKDCTIKSKSKCLNKRVLHLFCEANCKRSSPWMIWRWLIVTSFKYFDFKMQFAQTRRPLCNWNDCCARAVVVGTVAPATHRKITALVCLQRRSLNRKDGSLWRRARACQSTVDGLWFRVRALAVLVPAKRWRVTQAAIAATAGTCDEAADSV